MNNMLPHIYLNPCLKSYTKDLDKAFSPSQTVKNVKTKLADIGLDIVSSVHRIDNGRLGIPVFISMCGTDALQVMPTRKQMGKGSSDSQAEASAYMELMERYAFFSFWQNPPYMLKMTWKAAAKKFKDHMLPVSEMLKSVNDQIDPNQAEEILDLIAWSFYPSTNLTTDEIVWLPADWFRMINEFNGTSAGNTPEESILQGICELIERHTCAIISREKKIVPSINLDSCSDPTLQKLIASFKSNNINLILKDFSQEMPLSVVAAIAWDESTFPDSSEIVFTAGAASSPAKAAIRAITEVAQLGGDFCTNSCYESSGLPKYHSLAECAWLFDGEMINLDNLPTVENIDIHKEIENTLKGLQPIQVYCIETINKKLRIPAHYCIAPGLEFLEKDQNQSLGLFVGRKLAENGERENALKGFEILEKAYPNAFFIPFFHGLLELHNGAFQNAFQFFQKALPLQPDSDSLSMTTFYAAYSLTSQEHWQQALPFLQQAVKITPQMKEYAHLLGVCQYKLGMYDDAEQTFSDVLKIDKGSAMDLANRGLCRIRLGKLQQAKQDLVNALAIDSSIDFARQALMDLD